MTTENVTSDCSKQEWCSFPPSVSSAFIKQIEHSAAQRMVTEGITEQDVQNIKNRSLDLIPKDLSVGDERLEKLRKLCQLWEVDIHLGEIKSHRKFIGPVIVGVKKLLFPMIRFMLKDLIREQRDFNAAAIRLFADLCNQSKGEQAKSSPCKEL